ncbi:MAG: ATP-dependent Clp protease ATP-binding subunit [Polyangiaceae bacterium]|nr:ATP-dependent Clp protease ATP-binding subunit [Polyangiaceae bacterium]
MSLGRIEPELATLRKLAQQLAKQRVEPVTSVHWLAAISLHPGTGKDLLAERHLDSARILQATSGQGVEDPELVRSATEAARQVAVSMDASHTAGLHLLISLLGDASSAARRTLAALRVDPLKLRNSAMQLGLGRRERPQPRGNDNALPVERQKAPVGHAPPRPSSKIPTRHSPSARAQAVVIPIVPAAQSPRKKPRAAGEVVPIRPVRTEVQKVAIDRSLPDQERFELRPADYPMLNSLGRNLTLQAFRGELPEFIGRDEDLEELLDILAKQSGNSPCLIGPAGIGKSALVRGLAHRTATSARAHSLDNRIIVEICLRDLLSGSQLRGTLAGRLATLRHEVEKSERRVVLFFDDLHRVFSTEAADEAYTELKLLLGRGFPCIGTSTLEEFRRSVESDRALARHFSLVLLEEPSREDAFLILRSVTNTLGQHHKISYSDEALALSVAWSLRYLPARVLPEKAIAILDLAGARSRRRDLTEVGPPEVAEVVSDMADVPLDRLLQSDHERMLNLEQLLGERVVGHEEELHRIAKILRRNAAGLGSRRPIGTFLLLGPTGVGKTETAKAVAEVLFQSEAAMTRVDMSEYGEAHSVARLIGSPPGYIGHDAGGQLTEAVRKRPYQVVLLDEIEKAHPDVLTTFLAVFDEGRLTDGRGRTVDFTNVVLMLTSNIGSRETEAGPRRVGFGTHAHDASREYEARVTKAARDSLLPELYNRIDEVLAFRPLSRDRVRVIATRLLKKLALDLSVRHQVSLEFDTSVVERLLDLGGYDPDLGARPLKRAIARHIEAPVAEELLKHTLSPGDAILLHAEEGGIGLDTVSASAAE